MSYKRIIVIIISICILAGSYVSCSYWFNNRYNYIPEIPELAKPLKFYDITNENPYNFIDSGVRIESIQGHEENVTYILFNELKPYEDINIYIIDDIRYVFYVEKAEGEELDRWIGLKSSLITVENEQVKVFINGKRVKDVDVIQGQE